MSVGTLRYSGTLDIVTCWCGIPHAIPAELNDYRLRKHRDGQDLAVYCPLGHGYVPSGTAQVELERERRERAEARAGHLKDQLQASERSNAALRGVVTRTKRRIGKGVCPCCNRHFANVEQHMLTRHPEYAEAGS